MVRQAVRTVFAAVISLAIAAPLLAQSSQANPNAQKPKKHGNQVPDAGLDDPEPSQGANPFERAIEAVPVTVRADGTVVAELDESFDEAITVTFAADGTPTFGHQTGVAAANRAMRLLPARPLPQFFPTLEEKE
jgi:hypothetical protein